jgi:hypothetical protein
LYKTLYGFMALLLVSGDSFHLVPRIATAISKTPERFSHALGIGKMVTSISMTLFYVILWQIGVLFAPAGIQNWWPAVYGFATIRILLCVLPQNRWAEDEASPAWNLYRNIPFVLLGAMVDVLFFCIRASVPAELGFMWLAILISFACYLPVVFWSKKVPMLGMLMIPKTCAYIWVVFMGL